MEGGWGGEHLWILVLQKAPVEIVVFWGIFGGWTMMRDGIALLALRISLRRLSLLLQGCELHEGGIYLKSRPAHIFGKYWMALKLRAMTQSREWGLQHDYVPMHERKILQFLKMGLAESWKNIVPLFISWSSLFSSSFEFLRAAKNSQGRQTLFGDWFCSLFPFSMFRRRKGSQSKLR